MGLLKAESKKAEGSKLKSEKSSEQTADGRIIQKKILKMSTFLKILGSNLSLLRIFGFSEMNPENLRF